MAAVTAGALGGTTVRDALDSALVALRAAGVESPRLDAELLLGWALDTTRAQLTMHPEREVAGVAARRFRDAVRRRAQDREPVAYIIGRKAFRHLELAVDRRALIPRPETELLVEVAISLPAGATVADVGTGSGAVALALRQERPDLRVIASDVSTDALALARENAERLGLEIELLQADLLDGIGPVDAVVANLPYVDSGARLAPEIARHEPPLALFAGADGLDAIRRLVAQAGSRPALRFLALELGAGQAEAVAALMREHGFVDVEAFADLAAIKRVVVGRR